MKFHILKISEGKFRESEYHQMLWHCISFNKLDLENHFGGYVSISWYFKLSIYFKDRLTLRISLKYDHIMRYTGLNPAHFYSLSKVDPGGGAGAQYCRLVCTQGAWRGPYCSPSPSHDNRGMQHYTAESDNIIILCRSPVPGRLHTGGPSGARGQAGSLSADLRSHPQARGHGAGQVCWPQPLHGRSAHHQL